MLIILIGITHDYSSLLITVFSMIFTIVSILMSAFEYCLSSKFIHIRTGIIVSFEIKSKSAIEMRGAKYLSQIVFKTIKLNVYMARILGIRLNEIERLKPKLTNDGIFYTFIVAVDVSQYSKIENSMRNVLYNGDLIKVPVFLFVCFIFCSFSRVLYWVNVKCLCWGL